MAARRFQTVSNSIASLPPVVLCRYPPASPPTLFPNKHFTYVAPCPSSLALCCTVLSLLLVSGDTAIKTGCQSHPNFGIEGDRRAVYCAKHKLPGMVNVKAPRCRFVRARQGEGGKGRAPGTDGRGGDVVVFSVPSSHLTVGHAFVPLEIKRLLNHREAHYCCCCTYA